MKIGGLIIGEGIGRIVTDGRTLNGMVRAGHIDKPKYGCFPQVDEGNRRRDFDYKSKHYRIKYFDGSIYAFVVLTSEPVKTHTR
jgi:hypothetical protein